MTKSTRGPQVAPPSDPEDGVTPKLRGWLHVGMTPLVLIAGILLAGLATTPAARWSAIVFTSTAVMLFGTSALYHRGRWSPNVDGILRRLDHSNIFLIIAGSYTPFALLLPADQARTLLITVWSGALLGVAFRVFWVDAPRWLYTPIYVLLGWVAIFYLKPLLAYGGWTILILVATGGVLYSVGAVVYGTKRPNPLPRWFGFHEVFHAFTVAAFATHFVAATVAVRV